MMTPYKFLVGFMLTIAMLVVLGTASLLFAVRDFQFGLSQVAPASQGLIDDAKLASADATVARIQHDATAAQLVHDIADIETRSNARTTNSAASDMSAAALGTRLQALAAQPGLSSADQENLAAMRNQVALLPALEQSAASASDAAAHDQNIAAQRLAGGESAATLLAEYQGYSRVRAQVAALQTLSPAGIGVYLAHGHPAQLSIALVMFMGALGALLYLFPAYLTRPVPVTMAEIAVRLIFGACAALAFYVLANATVAGFSISQQVTQASTSSSLNPFTVSLIGILAGVLAEDIAKWIQERGRGMFQQGGASAAAAAPADSGGINPHGGPDTP